MERTVAGTAAIAKAFLCPSEVLEGLGDTESLDSVMGGKLRLVEGERGDVGGLKPWLKIERGKGAWVIDSVGTQCKDRAKALESEKGENLFKVEMIFAMALDTNIWTPH